MIEIKNSCYLYPVSGGDYRLNEYLFGPYCPICNGNEDDVGNRPVVNFSDWGGKYAGAFSVLGSRLGFRGAVSEYIAGSVIDVVDFQNLGENYKDNVMMEIRNGNIPND
ncbi:hypothetical protein [Pasteurella sp. PK-2025]|uniref:hypothetical protein n=1 Tax=Pasteurella sp. PK-2025 TaxID=3413133 RepID=UPI003C7566C8